MMSCSASSTSSEMPEEELAKAGIMPGLVRMSIGYTGTLEQRWAQLAHARYQRSGSHEALQTVRRARTELVERAGLEPAAITGLAYNPFRKTVRLVCDPGVNYMMAFRHE